MNMSFKVFLPNCVVACVLVGMRGQFFLVPLERGSGPGYTGPVLLTAYENTAAAGVLRTTKVYANRMDDYKPKNIRLIRL